MALVNLVRWSFGISFKIRMAVICLLFDSFWGLGAFRSSGGLNLPSYGGKLSILCRKWVVGLAERTNFRRKGMSTFGMSTFGEIGS